jgi:hypothetical protein
MEKCEREPGEKAGRAPMGIKKRGKNLTRESTFNIE